jgi:hypothetical protein
VLSTINYDAKPVSTEKPISQIESASSISQQGVAEQPEDEDGKAYSPLTVAIIRSRWLVAFATPCHSRGATFLEVGHAA